MEIKPNETTLAQVKKKDIQTIFDHIARNYDLANSVMSLGRHHYWRGFAVAQSGMQPGSRVLDLCCGTGMITADLAKKVGNEGKVTGLDFSGGMLAIARQRLKRQGLIHRVELVKGDATRLTFADNSFDCVVIGYGLRNVSDPGEVLREMYRVLKPGGKTVILETAKPPVPLIRNAYFLYLSKWFPLVGKLLSRHEEAYRYLYQSIIDFPAPDQFVRTIDRAGFMETRYTLLTLGAVAVYTGFKL